MIGVLATAAYALTACPTGIEPSCDGSLAEVLALSEPGDTIQLAGGSYQGSWRIEHDLTLRPLDVDEPVLLSGDLDPTLDMAQGDLVLQDLVVISNTSHAVRLAVGSSLTGTDVQLRGSNQLMLEGGVVLVQGGDLTLTDAVVSGGRAVTDGGLISVVGDVFLTDVTLRDGEAGEIGGLLFVEGRLEMTDALLEQGRAGDGGAVFSTGGGRFERVTIQDNVAIGAGGGALLFGDRTEIFDSRFLRNRAGLTGGGVRADDIRIEGSDICGNQAGTGGGIFAVGFFLGHFNVFTRNTATEEIGGLFSTDSLRTSVTFSHFVANSAPTHAAFLADGQVLHNLIEGNVSRPNEPVFEANDELGHTVVWDNTGRIPESAVGLIEADPELAPWTDCGSALHPGWYGAARDAGPADELDPDGSRADVGAFALGRRDDEVWNDLDDDGVVNLYDCAVQDPSIFPGADDVPYDGIDQDCRGDDDLDADDDGHRPVEHGGEDCDDQNPAAYPGAPENPRDEVDSNCDGWVGSTTNLEIGGCAVSRRSPSWLGVLLRQ